MTVNVVGILAGLGIVLVVFLLFLGVVFGLAFFGQKEPSPDEWGGW